MKIWCVDHGFSYNTYSELFFTKQEAQDRYDSLYAGPGSYRKLYQVEDIWGWCGRHFNKIINEVIASRDSGDDFIFVHGLVEELREAAAHCGIEMFNADAVWVSELPDRVTDHYALSVAWVSEGKLNHQMYKFEALGAWYGLPTIVERRSKWEATSNVE